MSARDTRPPTSGPSPDASLLPLPSTARLPNFCNLGIMLRLLVIVNLLCVASAVVRSVGNDAWERGAVDEARQHFAMAFAQAPHLPHVANNMAMVLSVGEKADYPQALATIQPVVEKFPDTAAFRDTRGHILIKLGRYEEAVKDLEFALPALPSKALVHQALAEAYRHLGLKDLADQHELLAKGDQASPPAAKAKPMPPK